MAAADSRISCLGTFPNREIGKVLSELDVLVIPSLWYENSPLVVHSAQAAKVPVIASDIGGLSEAITHEINGLLFERGNARALAVQIRRLAEDRVLLKHLSAQARQPKSMADYVDKIEDLYKMILRERKQG
jgi:glycosyltransferase involved in cell wall biosynthesis